MEAPMKVRENNILWFIITTLQVGNFLIANTKVWKQNEFVWFKNCKPRVPLPESARWTKI